MTTSILQTCLIASGALFAFQPQWPQALVFCLFGGVVAAQHYIHTAGATAQKVAKATEELAAKTEQLKALDAKVQSLADRMLRYETRR